MADIAARSERFETGMTTRRSVLGDAHVDRAETAKTPEVGAALLRVFSYSWFKHP